MDGDLTQVCFKHFLHQRGITPPRPSTSSSNTTTVPALHTPTHTTDTPLSTPKPKPSYSSHRSNGKSHRSVDPSPATKVSRPPDKHSKSSRSRTESGELKQFRCEYCGLVFGRKHHKERHVDNLHRRSRGYTCRLCGASFHQKPNFQRHSALVHGELPFRCDRCGQGFEKSNKLRKHQWAEHGDERSKD